MVLAYAYVRTLLVLETLLFAAGLLLHLSVLMMGPNPVYAQLGLPLFRANVIVGIPVFAVAGDGMWMNQIKSCPRWMWKGALTVWVYGLLITCVQILFGEGTLFDRALAISGFPLGFNAIFLCILHSVLWTDYLERSEVARRAMHSLAFVALGVIVFLAYRAGYLHHPRRTEQ